MTLQELKSALNEQVGMDTFPVQVEIEIADITTTADIVRIEHRNYFPKPTTALILSKVVRFHAEATLEDL